MAISVKRTARSSLQKYIFEALKAEKTLEPAIAARIQRRLLRDTRRLKALVDEHEAAKAQKLAARTKPRVVFDPFGFGAVVTLQKYGRQELIDRLEKIEDADALRQIAEVQHLFVDNDATRPEDLRLAIVRGAEERVADRRAAGS